MTAAIISPGRWAAIFAGLPCVGGIVYYAAGFGDTIIRVPCCLLLASGSLLFILACRNGSLRRVRIVVALWPLLLFGWFALFVCFACLIENRIQLLVIFYLYAGRTFFVLGYAYVCAAFALTFLCTRLKIFAIQPAA